MKFCYVQLVACLHHTDVHHFTLLVCTCVHVWSISNAQLCDMSLTLVCTVHEQMPETRSCLHWNCVSFDQQLISSLSLQPLVPTKQISASPIATLESARAQAKPWPTSLEKVHGEVVNFLFDLRRLFADRRTDEQAVLGLARDAEEQGVLGNIPVSSSDDGRIQLCPLTLTYLSRSKPAGWAVWNRTFPLFLFKSC